MNARDIAVAAVALMLGCLGPTAALVAGMQGTCGAAPIVVGALIAAAAAGSASSKCLGLLAVVFASVNIFGGFAVTARMLAMYKKKDRG